MSKPIYFFVYGTLKTGQCRERYWPASPLNVVSAWTFGYLFDLGAYPGLLLADGSISGNSTLDRVAGELWSFQSSDTDVVTQVLDRIECTNQPGYSNEYDRVESLVTILEGGMQVLAQTYIYSCAAMLRQIARRIPADCEVDGDRYAIWPSNSKWL